LGIFTAFLDDEGVELVGVEAGGEGIETERHGAPLTVGGRAGVLHGALSAVMQDEEGQIIEAHSISAGLDYPGTGPQHAHLRDTGRARYEAVTDEEALAAFREISRLEGIIPALETAHALAWTLAQDDGELDLVCLSGRGDKDLAEVLGAS
jgi:tryptophan synthase beta chain